MTRDQLLTEVLQIMGLTDTLGVSTADAALTTYIQNRIQSGVNTIWNDAGLSFKRRQFGLYLGDPISGTLAFTKGNFTGTVSGQTPSNSWVGCTMVLTGNGFPLRVASVSGQIVTFDTPILAATSAATAFTQYFDGVLYPVNCNSIAYNTMKLAGHRVLAYMDRPTFELRKGYFNAYDTNPDYGFASRADSVINVADISQPTAFTLWGSVTISGIVRKIINVYPLPDQAYALNFDGFAKPTLMTSGSDVPDIPEQFHVNLLSARIKLDMTEYPGFELQTSEISRLQEVYSNNLSHFKDEIDEPYEDNFLRPAFQP